MPLPFCCVAHVGVNWFCLRMPFRTTLLVAYVRGYGAAHRSCLPLLPGFVTVLTPPTFVVPVLVRFLVRSSSAHTTRPVTTVTIPLTCTRCHTVVTLILIVTAYLPPLRCPRYLRLYTFVTAFPCRYTLRVLPRSLLLPAVTTHLPRSCRYQWCDATYRYFTAFIPFALHLRYGCAFEHCYTAFSPYPLRVTTALFWIRSTRAFYARLFGATAPVPDFRTRLVTICYLFTLRLPVAVPCYSTYGSTLLLHLLLPVYRLPTLHRHVDYTYRYLPAGCYVPRVCDSAFDCVRLFRLPRLPPFDMRTHCLLPAPFHLYHTYVSWPPAYPVYRLPTDYGCTCRSATFTHYTAWLRYR